MLVRYYRNRSADLAPALTAGSMNRLPGIAGAWRVMRLAGWRVGAFRSEGI